MNKRWSVSLLALVTLTFAGTAAATSLPETAAAPAAEPQLELALPAELAEAPVCTGGAGTGPATAGAEHMAANPAEAVDAAAGEASWYYGICWTSCVQCRYDYQCPWGERCQFGVQCP